MAPTISQILSVSYPLVVSKKPQNQWAENALLRALEKQGGIVRKSLGPTLEAPLDYQANAGTAWMATEMQPTSLTATEVIQSASYTPAELAVPITWSNRTEATNPTENQKVALVAALIDNGLTSHDDAIEQALFKTSTQGFLGLFSHITDTGQSVTGGIDSAANSWWRNAQSTYVDDSDIESACTTVWNACAKGSGSTLLPTLLISDGPTQALFEGTQQANQRYVDTDDLKAGFKTISFKNTPWIFSQYGLAKVFMINTKNFQLVASKEYFRDKKDVQPLQGQNGYTTTIYSALQTVVSNRSRLGSVHL